MRPLARQDRTTSILREYVRSNDKTWTNSRYPFSDFVHLAACIGAAMEAYDEHHLLLAYSGALAVELPRGIV